MLPGLPAQSLDRKLQQHLLPVLALTLVACRDTRPPGAPAPLWREAPAAHDVGAACADLGELRVCWDAACPGGICAVPRAGLPDLPARGGWRCAGAGAARRCAERGALAGGFACQGDVCVQAHPRLPDDGEWTCAELAGAVLCAGGEPASGAVPGPPDEGWWCGPRRGKAERVCLDLDPDRPAAAGWRCGFEHVPRDRRRCVRAPPAAPALGDACTGDAACPRGARCAGRRCLPVRPRAECWLDQDCGKGRCVLGTCAT